MSPGCVGRVLSLQVDGVIQVLRANLRQVVASRIVEADFGPSGLEQVVKLGQGMLAQHAKEPLQGVDKRSGEVDRILGEILTLQENGLVRLYCLKRSAIENLLNSLGRALEEELLIRRRNALLKLLHDEIGGDGRRSRGILSRVSEDYESAGHRLGNLMYRSLAYKQKLDQEYLTLAGADLFSKAKFCSNLAIR